MTRLLVLGTLSVSIVAAQPNPFFGFDPIPQIREFLQLTDSQATAILQANRSYNEWTLEKQRRISEVQLEISREETGKSPLDPMALGIRHAEVETICRQIRDRAAEVQTNNLALLTDPQKVRLKMLEDALKLMPVIHQAQSIRMLDGPSLSIGYEVMRLVSGTDRFNRTDGMRLGFGSLPIPGCTVASSRWFDFSEFRPTHAGGSAPATNDGAHRWFDRTGARD